MEIVRNRRFMELYGPVHGRFERFCKARSYGTCDFKDLMHDSLLIACEKFDELKDEAAFLYFLFGIAQRIHANFRKKKTMLPLQPDDAARSSAEAGADQLLEIDELYAALNRIPEVYRNALILFEISGFSIREVSEIQDVSTDAVKQRLSRGRKMLLAELSEKEVTSIAI